MSIPNHFASITFLAAPWLWLLGLAALPLLIHLLGGRARRTIVIPTARFFHQSRSEAANHARVRDWLLLLVRSAAVAAIVLAFAQPAWQVDRAAAAGSGTVTQAARSLPLRLPMTSSGRHVIIILDASASMQRVSSGRSLFSEAQYQARQILGTLQAPADSAAVLIAGVRPRALLPDLTADFNALSERLDAAAPTWERADLRRAALYARRLLERDAATRSANATSVPNREIVFISDMQANQWPTTGGGQALESWFADVNGYTTVSIRQVGLGISNENISIVDLTTEPIVPIAGQQVTVNVTLENHSPDSAATASFVLTADDAELARPAYSLAPAQQRQVTYSHTFSSPGMVHLKAAIVSDMPDALPIDDTRSVCVRVRSGYRVGLVTPSPKTGAAYYISMALAPDLASSIRIENLGPQIPAYSEDSTWTSLDAIVICEHPDLTRQDVATLQDWIARAGLGAVWLIDTPEAADLLSEHSDDSGRVRQLPLTVTRPDHTDGATSLSASTQANDSLTAFLTSTGDTGVNVSDLLQGILSRTAYMPATTASGSANVYLATPEDRPIIASQSLGHGTLAMWAGSISPTQCDLTRSPLFPGLMQELVASVARPTASPAPCYVGHGCTVPLSGTALIKPGEDISTETVETVPVTTPFTLIGTPGNFDARIDRTNTPGVIWFQHRDTGTHLAGVTVRLDPLESDLTCLTPNDVLPKSETEPPAGSHSAIETSRVIGHAQSSQEAMLVTSYQSAQLWPILTLLSVLLLATQVAIAHSVGSGRNTQETVKSGEQGGRNA
ncbi:MAG: hypothetical protein D8M59_04100 [Planctomycetes bacterium]|nr:hypothetical protein [Planctomycetota bacterium]NOG55690.1 VWA domain-containing protein [Planctomycetota bacterium]